MALGSSLSFLHNSQYLRLSFESHYPLFQKQSVINPTIFDLVDNAQDMAYNKLTVISQFPKIST
jgi:hypothetical protein